MISVDQVSKRFGSLVAVDKLSFRIDRGEVVGFLGPNGAGKTTTMRLLTGVLQPDEGRVEIDGRPVGENDDDIRQRIGYLPESNPLYDEMLVCEYLEFAARLRSLAGAGLRSAVRGAVEETHLEDVFYRPVAEMSKGYRQRVGLAAALLHRPEILVLDEPTEGLDPNQRVEIRKLVSALGRERTILLSTHVMQEVEATCNRLLIVNRGSLVADGAVATLLRDRTGGAVYVVEVAGDNAEQTLASLDGVRSHTAEATDGRVRLRLVASGTADLRPRIFACARDNNLVLWELHRERASVEQLFRQLTGASAGTDGADVPEAGGDVSEADPQAAEVAQ